MQTYMRTRMRAFMNEYMNFHVQTLQKAGYDLEKGFNLAHKCGALLADILQVTIVRGKHLPALDAGKLNVRIKALLTLIFSSNWDFMYYTLDHVSRECVCLRMSPYVRICMVRICIVVALFLLVCQFFRVRTRMRCAHRRHKRSSGANIGPRIEEVNKHQA